MTRQTSIKRKLTFAIMTTSVTVLLLTGASFVSYELITFQRWLESYVSSLGEVVARNSTASLSFDEPNAALETLSTLSVEKHITAAAFYNTNGHLFAYWPTYAGASSFPEHPAGRSHKYES